MQTYRKIICFLLAAAALVPLNACGRGADAEVPEIIQQGSLTETAPKDQYPALPPAETECPDTEAAADAVSRDEAKAAQPEETVSPAEPETPEEPEAPARADRVDDEYFADAAFFGNSLVDGLRSFGKLQYGSFFAGTSASVLSVETIRDTHLSNGTPATLLDALLEEQHARIYVLLGINELGFHTASFVEMYGALLDKIAAAEPEAQIFVMSLTPITERRSRSEDLFTREKVEEFNAAIHVMADEHGYIYLDLYTPLADENGWLPQEESTDGVHFTADKYLQWAEYLRINYDGCAPISASEE